MEQRIKTAVRDVPDFPKPGILFKDITPILKDYALCHDIVQVMADQVRPWKPDGVAGIESRGFLFGVGLAEALAVPFIPVRKLGKLPYETITHKYDLEYGSAEVEMHVDAFQPGARILIHDDLLATGGTAQAAAALIKKAKGEIAGFIFLIHLSFLSGNTRLAEYSEHIHSLVEY
ncbi:MAG: adenine phosphoribosyltransferase [Flavobacteriales bacterium]|nr:adenine phosphoribosyltransferase [Flavobacteriales bacterium]